MKEMRREGIEIFSVGDRGVSLINTGEITLLCQKRIWWMVNAIDHAALVDRIIGMNSLTLLFSPLLPHEPFFELLAQYWHRSEQMITDHNFEGRCIEVPVIYDGEDLKEVAQYHKLTVAQLIQRHTAPIYTVYFVGFMPGFVFLGGMDSSIITPRRATPRLSVAAGSVGIGGVQTGVYPAASPGGWNILGHTDRCFFNLEERTPSLFQPGDQLKFTIAEPHYD